MKVLVMDCVAYTASLCPRLVPVPVVALHWLLAAYHTLLPTSVLVSIGEMLLFCVFSLFILVLQSEDEEPDNDRQMEELQQDSNKKVTLHFINLNMG